MRLHFDLRFAQKTLVSDLTRNKCLQQMVSHFVVGSKLLDLCSNDGFLLLENSDGSVNLNVSILFESVVLKSHWHLVLSFLVENNFEVFCVVSHLINCSHVFLVLIDNSGDDNDLIKRIYKFTYRKSYLHFERFLRQFR